MFTGNETVADVVRSDFRTSRVFKNRRIDFCCKGQKTLHEVCAEKELNEPDLLTELNQVSTAGKDAANDFDRWPLDLLADYIEKKHHRYVNDTVPLLQQYLKKLVVVHGHEATYLSETARLFELTANNLLNHMHKEENVLFPAIRELAQSSVQGRMPRARPFGSIRFPIEVMRSEHETEGGHLAEIESLTNHYHIPQWACNTFMVAMKMLNEFQDDLHVHIHLENNILFPKAIELEQKRQ